ncbi:unnamed protein product [Sphagnum balticum]
MRRDDRVPLEEAPSLRLLGVHAADALSFPFDLALIVFCKERASFPYTRAGAFALSLRTISSFPKLPTVKIGSMFAADGQDWIPMEGCGFQSSFWAENVTLRTRGSDNTACSGKRFPLPAPVPHNMTTCFCKHGDG